MLAEYVRSGLSRQICNSLQGSDKKIRVFTVHPEMELILKQNMQDSEFGFYIVLPPDINMKFMYNVNEAVKKSRKFGHQPIMLVTPEIRKGVRRLLEKDMKMVTVLSYNEVVPEAELEAIGMVGIE